MNKKSHREKVDKQEHLPLVDLKERLSSDRADLTQMMIIIGGFAVAAILAIGTLTGVVLTKGEWAANCINNGSAFMSGDEVSREDCSRGEPDENGEICQSTEGLLLPMDVPDGVVEVCANLEDVERVAEHGGCIVSLFKDISGNVVYTLEECLPESEPEPEPEPEPESESAKTKEECERKNGDGNGGVWYWNIDEQKCKEMPL